MELVFRRARGARSLLLAATGATLIATVLLTGLADYSRDVVDAGRRSAVASAPPEERSVLVQGAAGNSAAALAERDSALRSRFAGGFAGLDTRIAAAGYATGRQLTGDVGNAVPNGDGLVFASVVFLDGLANHADLLSGSWPQAQPVPAGAARPAVQTALAEAAATTLHAKVGGRIQINDRLSGKLSDVTVVGIWRPRTVSDPYWRLVPGVAAGVAPQSSTYGPFVISHDDFLAGYAASASAAWMIEPDLARADVAHLDRVRQTSVEVTARLADQTGLGTSGLVTTRMDRLIDRLKRADLVGRSALVTPMLLIAVLGGYALLLVAALLTEQRRGETALLRARGAARYQLAGLAAREAALVVVPVAALAPLLAVQALGYVDSVPLLAAGHVQLSPRLDALTWLVAGLAAAGCALGMLVPALRRGGTYVAELAGRSRPSRWGVAQRAGLDLALIGLAVLGWFQLRQYSSPLAGDASGGTLGIDPLLAATPTLGVLAGAVVALRVLPPLTRLAERYVDRKRWTATMLGMWQAGRRPHAGPVLLLALAVAVSTLAWCLAGTSQRSVIDQANHQIGADLRLVETSPSPPDGRAGQVAGLPGIAATLPAWRDQMGLGPQGEPTSMVALDSQGAAAVVRLRDDLAGGSVRDLFSGMAAKRSSGPIVGLPQGTRRLSGEVRTSAAEGVIVSTSAVFAVPGGYRQVPLGTSQNGQPLRFSMDLFSTGLAGFVVETSGTAGAPLTWKLTALRADSTPVDLAGGSGWQGRDNDGTAVSTEQSGPELSTKYVPPLAIPGPARVVVARAFQAAPVPVVATPEALSALRQHVGARARLSLVQRDVDVLITGTVKAVPGTTDASALLVDLPSLADRLFYEYGVIRDPQEWWLAIRPGGYAAATAAAAKLNGLQALDRRSAAQEAGRDPYGVGARAALFAAALGAILLAALGIGVDVRATVRRRMNELAVLQTLGAGPRLLARSLIAEQAFLAGIGVLAGLLVGIGVAVTMAPLVILTPAAGRPVPSPLLDLAWWPAGATAAGLFLLKLGLSALVAISARERLAAAQLRIGADT